MSEVIKQDYMFQGEIYPVNELSGLMKENKWVMMIAPHTPTPPQSGFPKISQPKCRPSIRPQNQCLSNMLMCSEDLSRIFIVANSAKWLVVFSSDHKNTTCV